MRNGNSGCMQRVYSRDFGTSIRTCYEHEYKIFRPKSDNLMPKYAKVV